MTETPDWRERLIAPLPNGPRWLPSIDDEVSLRRLQRVIILVLAAGLAAFLVRGADRPADPLVHASDAAVPRTPLKGFGEIAVVVTDVAGRSVQHCVLLAQSVEQRTRGLKGAADLGGYEGMLFRSNAAATDPFSMRNTAMPLSIAFFDRGGRLLDAQDMAPCADLPSCPEYRARSAYWSALAVPRGRLTDLGIRVGSRIEPRGPCR